MVVKIRRTAVEALLFSLLAIVIVNWPINSWFDGGYKAAWIIVHFCVTYAMVFSIFLVVKNLLARWRA